MENSSVAVVKTDSYQRDKSQTYFNFIRKVAKCVA